ncbi:hypothetical protein [Campylobacter taeniopygiae]|uniref:hypothetical protein n=1 Tax=Campylobacter taeniopygiae TaxID=2510188 RepID=UPI003D6BED3A
MKIILAILALVFLSSCVLIKSKEEKERDEYMDDFFKRHEYFTVSDLEVLNKILPQVLSNGCKYYRNEHNL